MFYIEGTLPHKHRTAVTRLREFMDLVGDRSLFETVFFENGDGMTVSQWKG
jgi:predicted O-methyltransferase YrrM